MLLLQFVVVGVVLCLIFWLIVFRMRRRRLYALADKLPGSPQLPFIGHLHRFMGDTQDLYKTINDLSCTAIRQGGITKLWLGPTFLCMITDPVDMEYVLRTCLNKADILRFMRKVLGNGVIFAPASIWRRRRKIAATGFSTKHLELFQEVFREKSDLLAHQLQHKVGAGAGDLWPEVSSYTIDSILETLCGRGYPRSSEDYARLLSSIGVVLDVIGRRFFKPWLQPDWLYRLAPSYTSYKNSSDFLYTYVDDVITYTRMELKTEESAKSECDQYNGSMDHTSWTSFLRHLITQSSKSQEYSNLELREEFMSIAGAGTDTSGVGTCFTLLLLARHQDVQEKVYQELTNVFGSSDRPLVKEDLPKLCYLEQVIKESLRLYPPVPITARKTDEEITLPSGRVLPAGCEVLISMLGVQRNPEYWGEDARQFQPDRFSPERYNPQHPCVYMPFSAGPRVCLGYQYATMSMKTSLATVLRKYRLRAADDAPIRVKYEVMLKPVDGFNVILEDRH